MPRIHPVRHGTFVDLGAFGSPALGGDRRVRVYVPPPPPPGSRRPTLVMFDGQNVFGDDGSFSGGWHTDEAVDRLVAGKPAAPIVVAIDHGGEARIDELSPFPHGTPGGAESARGGHEDALLDVIVNQILPAVHERFEVQPWYHVIGGSSMGGLAALYAHVRLPDVFPGVLAMSPSLWFGKNPLFELIERQPIPRFSRVYLDCGGREGKGRMLPLVESMAMHFVAKGWSTGSSGERRVMWRPDKRGAHNEAAWRRRLPKALRFLFG